MKHDIRKMGREEAHPASSGRVCKVCDRYELVWGPFGLAGASSLDETECPGKPEADD